MMGRGSLRQRLRPAKPLPLLTVHGRLTPSPPPGWGPKKTCGGVTGLLVFVPGSHNREREMCYDGAMDSPECTYGPVANTEQRLRRMGRPPRYETPEEMATVIRDFFDYCTEKGQPPLVTSLALALGANLRVASTHNTKY